MAKVKVATRVASDALFGCSDNPVIITNATFDFERNCIEFEIEGADIPDVPMVNAIVRRQQNRIGQKLDTMTFEVIE